MPMKKNNKILIVVPGLFFHIEEGAKNRINSFIETYKQAGYEVTVFLTYPLHCIKYLPNRNKFLHPSARWFMIPSFSYFRHPLLNKLSVFMGQFMVFILSHIYKYKFIQAEHNVGGILCRYKKKETALIVDFHGDSKDEFLFNHPACSLKDWRVKFIKKATYISVKIADKILIVSENLRQELIKQSGLSIENYFIIPCSVDLERFKYVVKPLINLDKERIIIGYCGGLQKWQNIEIILDVILKLRELEPRVFFMLVTPNPLDEIKDRLEKIGTENYTHLALKSYEVPAYLTLMDATFLIRDNRILNIVSSPTKIAESLAAGVPIIATKDSGDINEVVVSGKNGYIVEDIYITDKDINHIYEYLIRVKTNREFYSDLCRNSVKNRVWHDISDRLLSSIANL